MLYDTVVSASLTAQSIADKAFLDGLAVENQVVRNSSVTADLCDADMSDDHSGGGDMSCLDIMGRYAWLIPLHVCIYIGTFFLSQSR